MEEMIGMEVTINKDCTSWSKNADYMQTFVRCVGQWLNEALMVNKFITVERVFNALSIPITPEVIEHTKVYRDRGKRLTFTVLYSDAKPISYKIVIGEE